MRGSGGCSLVKVKEPRFVRLLKRNRKTIGRVVLVLLALLVCILPVLLVNNIIGYLPLLALVFLVIVSYVYLRVLARSLEYSEDSLAPSCERGEEIEFVIWFKNKSPLVFLRLEPTFYISDLFGNMDVAIPASMVLMPFENRDFRFRALFEHIGTYSAGVSEVVIYDLLGLFSHKIVNPNRHNVKVMPKVFDVSRVNLSNVTVQETKTSSKPVLSDDMDYAGVREYAYGDQLKTIHWKLSSRMTDGQYLTRLFESVTKPGLSIILDTKAPEYDANQLMYVFDGIVESALSVNEYARNHGVDSRMLLVADYGYETQMTVCSRDEYVSFADTVPRIQVGNDDDALNLLQKEGYSTYGQGNVALCTSHVSEGIVSALIDLKNQQRNPVLFLTVPPSMEEDELKRYVRPLRRLDDARIVYYVIVSAEDLSSGEAGNQ